MATSRIFLLVQIEILWNQINRVGNTNSGTVCIRAVYVYLTVCIPPQDQKREKKLTPSLSVIKIDCPMFMIMMM